MVWCFGDEDCEACFQCDMSSTCCDCMQCVFRGVFKSHRFLGGVVWCHVVSRCRDFGSRAISLVRLTFGNIFLWYGIKTT